MASTGIRVVSRIALNFSELKTVKSTGNPFQADLNYKNCKMRFFKVIRSAISVHIVMVIQLYDTIHIKLFDSLCYGNTLHMMQCVFNYGYMRCNIF